VCLCNSWESESESLLKDTLIPGCICFIWTYNVILFSLFDFCVINFTTKTLFLHDCALFI